MNRATQQLVSTILKGEVVAFRKAASSATDPQMIEALRILWQEHRKELEESEITLDLFLEIFNYQYNKYLINRPSIEEAKKPEQARGTQGPINARVVKDVFKLARERQALAY